MTFTLQPFWKKLSFLLLFSKIHVLLDFARGQLYTDMVAEHLKDMLCSLSDVPAKLKKDLQLACSRDKGVFNFKKKKKQLYFLITAFHSSISGQTNKSLKSTGKTNISF